MGRKLYVGNLPYEVGETELQDLFGRAGSVESVTVMANTNPGRELMCPVCPKKLRYVTTRNEDGYVHQKRDSFKTAVNVHVYECASHGRFHMGPNGRLTSGG